jgi:hypothetical protein
MEPGILYGRDPPSEGAPETDGSGYREAQLARGGGLRIVESHESINGSLRVEPQRSAKVREVE